MSKLLVFILVLISFDITAQNVGINNTDPQSTLDIKGSLRLRPQVLNVQGQNAITVPEKTSHLWVDGTPTGDVTITYTFQQEGDIMYISNFTSYHLVMPGAYTVGPGISSIMYIDGEWRPINENNSGWTQTGNSGTNPTQNFIGTTDNQPLVVKTNNTARMEVKDNGIVGINGSGDLTGIEMGHAVSGKQTDAGKIQYGGFGGDEHVVNIVGGGTDLAGTDRKMKIWAEGGIDINGEIQPNGVAGAAGQVLQSNGNGTMSWANLEKYPNSRAFVGNTIGISESYSTFNFTVPADVSEILVEAWAGGDCGNFFQLTMTNISQVKGGDGGSYVCGIIKVTSGENLTIYAGNGGNIGSTGGVSQVLRNSTVLLGTTPSNGFIAFVDPGTGSDGVLKFVEGAQGRYATMDYKQYSSDTFVTIAYGADGGESYSNTSIGKGSTVAYNNSTNLPISYTNYGSQNNGQTPGGGAGASFVAFNGVGGVGMVILRW